MSVVRRLSLALNKEPSPGQETIEVVALDMSLFGCGIFAGLALHLDDYFARCALLSVCIPAMFVLTTRCACFCIALAMNDEHLPARVGRWLLCLRLALCLVGLVCGYGIVSHVHGADMRSFSVGSAQTQARMVSQDLLAPDYQNETLLHDRAGPENTELAFQASDPTRIPVHKSKEMLDSVRQGATCIGFGVFMGACLIMVLATWEHSEFSRTHSQRITLKLRRREADARLEAAEASLLPTPVHQAFEPLPLTQLLLHDKTAAAGPGGTVFY